MWCAEGGRGTDWYLPPPFRRQPRVGGFAAPDWRVRLATGLKETAAAAGPSREASFRALLLAAPHGIVIPEYRKSVLWAKCVSVRVDLGGLLILTNTITHPLSL